MIKKGMQVEVICGKDKGKKGEVITIFRSEDKAKVKGINIIKKHEKTTKEKKGGIISKENFYLFHFVTPLMIYFFCKKSKTSCITGSVGEISVAKLFGRIITSAPNFLASFAILLLSVDTIVLFTKLDSSDALTV